MPTYNYIPPVGDSIGTDFPNVNPKYYQPPSADGVPLALGNAVNNPYLPPTGGLVGIQFPNVGPYYYVPPLGNAVPLEFAPKDSSVDPEPKPTQYLFPVDILSQEFGESQVFARFRELRALGADSQEFGGTSLKLAYQLVGVKGFDASIAGVAIVENWNKNVTPTGYDVSQYGRPLVYNYLQHLRGRGVDTSLYGKPYMQGGVKFVTTKGFATDNHGKPVLVNTTADQYAAVPGIKPQVLPVPSVSPRILYTKGFNANSFGGIRLERSPMPMGEDHSRYGNQTVWYHTRELGPSAINSFDAGYPVVFDPTQFIQTPSLIDQGIFGDVRAKNINEFIRASGIDAPATSDYSTIENLNRAVTAVGFDSASVKVGEIFNKSPSIAPTGIDVPSMPDSAIAFRIRTIQGAGFDHLSFGRALFTKTPELLPKGFDAQGFGANTVWYKDRELKPSGIFSQAISSHIAWFRYRYLMPAGLSSQAVSDNNILTHGNRTLEAKGAVFDASGRAWVSFGVRLVEPNGIYKELPSKHAVVRHQNITGQGFVATEFGDRIIPISQSIYTQGFAGKFGSSAVALWTHYLSAKGFFSTGYQEIDRFGRVATYNLTQHIQQNFDVNNGLAPIRWDGWTLLENRNKVIGVISFNAQMFGYSKIDNNAEVIKPVGLDAQTVSSTFMISHTNRPIQADGIEAPYISSWAVVYNDAFLIKAHSNSSMQSIGAPAIANTRRYYDKVGGFDTAIIDAPAIDFRVRTIDIEPRFSIGPPIIPMPAIHLDTQYAHVLGSDIAIAGLPSLVIQFNILQPKWAHRDFIGEPALKNLTPELATYGRNHEEYGDSFLRLQYRNLYQQGVAQTIFGLSGISDRTKKLVVNGWHSLTVPQKHNVIKTGAPAYSEQRIDLDGSYDDEGEYTEGYGIGLEQFIGKNPFGRPAFNQNVVYAINNSPATGYGTPAVRSNSIIVDTGYYEDKFSAGAIVSLKLRDIILEEEHAIGVLSSFGKPIMSPLTIWAVMEAPKQAKDNHSANGTPHYVDGYKRSPAGAYYGRPRIENKDKALTSYGISPLRVPSPRIHNKRSIISTSGIPKPYFPSPAIPFTEQQLTTEQKSNSTVYGRPTLTIFNLHRSVVSKGFNSNNAGKPDISNWIRTLYHLGYDALLMGKSKGGDNPYMWQGLRIGEYVPFVIEGIDGQDFGDTVIGLRVRGVDIQGFNAFISDYSPSQFNERMKVTGTPLPPPSTITVAASGFASSELSYINDIKNHQQFIRPDGNSDQFRKGGYHA